MLMVAIAHHVKAAAAEKPPQLSLNQLSLALFSFAWPSPAQLSVDVRDGILHGGQSMRLCAEKFILSLGMRTLWFVARLGLETGWIGPR
jgi:hypothetical protein